MKSNGKKIISALLRKLGYKLERIPLPEEAVSLQVVEKGKAIIKRISPQFVVLNGIFKGLKYPSLDITEAALVPKIIGSYESQLHPIIKEIISTPYSDIIDVGCAEGYYAVGLASKMPYTTIHGFDINERDLLFCKKMSEYNGVSNITFNNYCSPSVLLNFNFRTKGLIFCDSEGYELQLFTPEVIKALYDKNVDALVELHEVIIPGITSELILRFKDLYNIKIISTNNKQTYNWNGLDTLSEEDRNFAVFEHRGGVNKNIYMEWAFFQKKENLCL